MTPRRPLPPVIPAHRPSVACLRRMPAYLQMLRTLQAEGRDYVSGTVLARVHHLEAVLTRKDLAETGIVGTPRRGFQINELAAAIEKFLGWDRRTKAVVVGCGNLGSALIGNRGFQELGLEIVGAFDLDPRKVGRKVHRIQVLPVSSLEAFVARSRATVALLTVPAEGAQAVAEQLARCGIRGIWNFAPAKLQLPSEIIVQKEDLAEGLAVLVYRLRLAAGAPGPRTPAQSRP